MRSSPAAAHELVEQELRIAVDVERRFAFAVFAEAGACAVHRRRRRVDERHFLGRAEFEQIASNSGSCSASCSGRRVSVVSEHAPWCSDGGDRAVERAVLAARAGNRPCRGSRRSRNPRDSRTCRRCVRSSTAMMFVFAALVERLDEVRADEAGGAGYDDIHDRASAVHLEKSSSGSDDRRAELADDDARRPVGEHARLRPARRRAASMTPSVAITVSPAPLTSYTSRAWAGTCSRSPSRIQRHAFFAARHQQRVRSQLAAQLAAPCASSSRLVLPAPRHFAKLGAVRREQRRAAIARVVVAFRIDEHRLARRARQRDHALDVREPALAVVGQDDRVACRADALRNRAAWQRRTSWLGLGLEIDAQQLLLAADDAQLDRGVQARRRGAAGAVMRLAVQQSWSAMRRPRRARPPKAASPARRAPPRCARRWPRRRAAPRCGRS